MKKDRRFGTLVVVSDNVPNKKKKCQFTKRESRNFYGSLWETDTPPPKGGEQTQLRKCRKRIPRRCLWPLPDAKREKMKRIPHLLYVCLYCEGGLIRSRARPDTVLLRFPNFLEINQKCAYVHSDKSRVSTHIRLLLRGASLIFIERAALANFYRKSTNRSRKY